MKLRLLLTCACVIAPPALAENRALLVGTEGFGEETADVDVSGAAEALEAAGFNVVSGTDLEIDALREGLGSLLSDEAPERSVILMTGRFAHAGAASWYLPAEALAEDDETEEAEAPTLATVDATAVSLTTVLEIAARSPGGAVVLLGSETQAAEDDDGEEATEDGENDDDAPFDLGTGLASGLGTLSAPQGVTVILGEIPDILAFAEDVLVTPGLSLPEMLEQAEGLEAHGFLSERIVFLPEDEADPEAEEPVAEEDEALAAERAVWQAAQESDTVIAYEAYLARYPDGDFAGEARDAIDALAEDPERREAALGLDASARQQIQRDLTVLEYDTRGVDGVFGPGTRGAIEEWQQENGLEPTGFLTAEQIDVLRAMAVARTAELDEAEREEGLERERADRAYWEDIGRGQDEAGLRAYLDRFPDGLFADIANARLSEIEAADDRAAWERAEAEDTDAAYRGYLETHGDGAYAARARARLAEMGADDALAADEAAWQTAQEADIADGYAQYLETFPDGAFSEPAAARLAELTAEAAPAQDAVSEEQAREAEAALGLNSLARSLIEVQLQVQGFEPGRVDGSFDDDTRAALRNYQEARDLPATGYIDRDTLNRMVADGLPLPR